MVLDLENAAHVLCQSPGRRCPHCPRYPVAVAIAGCEGDGYFSPFGSDGEETLHIGNEVPRIDAEEGIADCLENGTLPHPVRPREDIDAGGEGEFRIAVGFDVFEMNGEYLHG